MQTPTGWDDPNPQKNPSNVYDPQFLLGTIPVSGSVSTAFDLSGWTNFALMIVPNGTILGGTTLTVQAAKSLQDTFYNVTGTSGAAALTLQFGSATNTIISPISILAPLRFVKFTAGGTQSAAQTLTLLVK